MKRDELLWAEDHAGYSVGPMDFAVENGRHFEIRETFHLVRCDEVRPETEERIEAL